MKYKAIKSAAHNLARSFASGLNWAESDYREISTTTMSARIVDRARMAPAIYVLTRAQNDFSVNVLDLVVGTGVFDAEECVKVARAREGDEI